MAVLASLQPWGGGRGVWIWRVVQSRREEGHAQISVFTPGLRRHVPYVP